MFCFFPAIFRYSAMRDHSGIIFSCNAGYSSSGWKPVSLLFEKESGHFILLLKPAIFIYIFFDKNINGSVTLI